MILNAWVHRTFSNVFQSRHILMLSLFQICSHIPQNLKIHWMQAPIKKQLVQNEMKHDQVPLFVGSSFTDIKDKLYKMAICIVCCVQEGMSYDCFVIWESVIFDQFAVLMFAPLWLPFYLKITLLQDFVSLVLLFQTSPFLLHLIQ